MEGSESSINRIGRTIWTVWGYLTGAVGRYLRPESPNKDNQDAPFKQEEAISNVTHNESYRELKEDEEKEEKGETAAWPQREKPQSSVSVRTAAVQWEKIHSGDTSKQTCTGVVWNAAVQKEVQQYRDTEENLDNNNKAAQTKSNYVFEEADQAFTDADMGSLDIGAPRSFDTDPEDKGDENDVDAAAKEDESVIDHVVDCEHAENEEEEILEGECDFGDEVYTRELPVEKLMEHTEDQHENEEDEDKQRNQGIARDEDEASTHMADDLSSQLTYSTREKEDLLNKGIKVDDEYIGETKEHEASTTPEREVVDVSDEETVQETVGMEKNEEQRESKLDEAQNEFLKEMVETEGKLLEALMASAETENSGCSVESESTPTPEMFAIEANIQDTVGTVNDGQHEAGQQLSTFEVSKSSDELDICKSKLDGAQNYLTQGRVSTTGEPLQESMTRQMENREIYEKEPEPLCKGFEIQAELTSERCLIDGIEETNQGTVGTVKDVEHESGLELSEAYVLEAVDVCDSNLDEQCMEETTEYEAAMTPEREGSDANSEEIKQGAVEMEQDRQHELCQQLNESKATEINLDKSQLDFFERMVETECKLLEKPVASQEAEHTNSGITNGSTPTSEMVAIEARIQDTVGMVKEGQHEAEHQSSESEGSKNSDEPNICESKLDGAQNDLTQGVVGTTGEPLQEPMTRQMENREIYEKEPEPLCKGAEIKAELTPERGPIDGIEETTQGTVETGKHVEQVVGQDLSESHVLEAVDVCDSKLDEQCMEETTEDEAAMTPEREGSDANSEEIKQGTVEMVQDEHHELSQQLNESKASETKLDESQNYFLERKERLASEAKIQDTVGTVNDGQHEAGQQLCILESSKISEEPDICESKLDGAQNDVTQGRVGTTGEPLQEPMTRQVENAEINEKEPEPLCKEFEIQGTVGTVKDVENEACQELSESHVMEAFDIYDSKLDKKCMDETTEDEAAQSKCSDTNSEEIKQGAVEIEQDQQHELSQQSQIVFVERMVETGKLLEELVTGQLENEETCKEEEEPISQNTEHKAAVTPERELIDILEVRKPETVGTAKDGDHEMEHQLSQFRGFENADKPDIQESNLVDVQNEHKTNTTGQMENAEIYEKEAELTSKVCFFKLASGHAGGDSNLTAVVMEADQVEHHEEETEVGNTPETEVQLLDIIGSQLPEEVVKQDSELVAAEPRNQSGTSQTISNFSQEVRAEVAADDLKKSAEIVRSLQPTAREKCALQETRGQWTLEQGSLLEKSISGNASESGSLDARFPEMQRLPRKSSPAEEVNETAFCEAPSSSPQELGETQYTTETNAKMVTDLTMDETKVICVERKIEVLETRSKLTAVSDHDMANVNCELSEAETGPQTEGTVEILKQPTEAEAPVPDDRSESQTPLNRGERTVHGGSTGETEPCGHIEHSGALDLPESETALENLEMLRNPHKDAELKEFQMFELKKHPQMEGENPDEAKIGMLDEIKAMTASLEDVEEIKSGLTQGSEERLETGTIKTKEEEMAMEASESDSADLETHNELLSNLVENKNNLLVETMDVESEVCGKTEPMKEKLQNAQEEHQDNASKVDAGETGVDSNKSLQDRGRAGLKRGSEKMARNEEPKPSVPKGWGVLEQGSSLDCTVQKSKIAVKNRFTRPPKDPRTLINMISVEPSVASRPSQPSVPKKSQGVGPSVLPPGVIGFKLPGLGGGALPILRKTDTGKKLKDEGDAQSVTTQKSDSLTDPKEDFGKKELPTSKPKWTPPRHPGMGNPLMMSELKSKLKKSGND